MAGTVNNPPLATPVKSQGFYSFVVSINDDDVYSWEIPANGFVMISTTGASNNAIIWFRETLASGVYLGSSFETANNTVLNGTTGNDAKATFSTAGTTAYLENRLGVTAEWTVTIIGANDAAE